MFGQPLTYEIVRVIVGELGTKPAEVSRWRDYAQKLKGRHTWRWGLAFAQRRGPEREAFMSLADAVRQRPML
jgi:hypothetical protein